jgi:Na+-transporting methylmalonyl-CoA/oxaloacetate decarboxylase gamma subunit
MNPKQLACIVLLLVVGGMVYVSQIVHRKVAAMKQEAETAESAAVTAENDRQMAEILTAKTKVETEDIRRFLKAWTPHIEKTQTEQEVDAAIEFSLRDKGITLVRSRRSEVKVSNSNKLIPKTVIASIVIEDEYAKVQNWLGDLERRLPLSRVRVCKLTGGGTASQLKLEVSIETPLVNLAAADSKPRKA